MKQRVEDHLAENLKDWHWKREEDPLGFGPYLADYLADVFKRLNNVEAPGLCTEYLWITTGSYYHWRLVMDGKVDQVEHLWDVPLPKGLPPRRPSAQALEGHRVNYSLALVGAKSSDSEWERAGVKDEASRHKALDTDHQLVWLQSGFAQMIEIEGQSTEPASHTCPLMALPQPFQDSAATPVVAQASPPDQGAPAAPVAVTATPAPAVPGTSGKPSPQQKQEAWKRREEARTTYAGRV